MTSSARVRRVGVLLSAVLALTLMAPLGATAQTDPRQDLPSGTDSNASGTGNPYTVPNADAGIAARNVELLANRPKPRWTAPDGSDLAAGAFSQSNIGSDLAFTGNYAISGNYRGFGVFDVSDPANPTLVTTVNCIGGQGDPSVYGNLLFISVESTSARVDCTADSTQPVFRGVRIFDISDINNPQYVAAVQTCRGSHTHTVVEDPNDDENVYIYVSGTAGVRAASQLAGCANPAKTDPTFNEASSRYLVEVIKVPLDSPEDAAVVNMARLFLDESTGRIDGLWPGGNHGPGTQSTSETDACHDITAYPEIGLAAGACEGNGLLIDITDPVNPKRIDAVLDPNFAYWHSATFNNDGTKVVFTDEWGGGGAPRCRPTDPDNWGADAIFDIVQTEDGPKMELRSYYKVPNVQSTREVCVAHNGNLIPVPGRDVMVQAWYEGGFSVFDFTDSSNPVELAYFDRGPYGPPPFNPLGGYWSVYWYNGNIYGNEIFLGFDTFDLLADGDAFTDNELEAARTVLFDEHNAQAQERIEWDATFALARATVDQIVRDDDMTEGMEGKIRNALDMAEQFLAMPKKHNVALSHFDRAVHLLLWQADVIEGKDKPNQGDADRLRDLAQKILDLKAAS